jgi:hypothetical protein
MVPSEEMHNLGLPCSSLAGTKGGERGRGYAGDVRCVTPFLLLFSLRLSFGGIAHSFWGGWEAILKLNMSPKLA